MMQKRGLSIFQYLLITYMVIVVFLVLVSGFIQYRAQKKALEADARSRLTEYLNSSVSYFQNVYAEGVMKDLQFIATSPSLDGFLTSGAETVLLTKPQVERLFLSFTGTPKSIYRSLRFIDVNGVEQVATEGRERHRSSPTGFDLAPDPGNAARLREVSGLFKRLRHEKPGAILFEGPLREEGRLTFLAGISKADPEVGGFGGSVVFSCDLGAYLDYLSKLEYNGFRVVSAFDAANHALVSPVSGPDRSKDTLFAAQYPIKVGQDDRVLLNLEFALPSEALARERMALLRTSFFSWMVLILVIAGVVGVVSRRLSRPLRQLVKATNRLAKGDLLQRLDVPAAKGELRVLVDSFNRMLEDLAKITVSRDRLVAETAERQRAEGDLDRLTEILESTTDLVSCATPDQKVLYMNRAGRKMVGWDDGPLESRQIGDIHPRWALEKIVTEGIPAAIERGVWVGETVVLAADGREVSMSQLILAHRSEKGELDYISTIMRDISEQKQLEKQLRESVQQVEKAHQELKGATAQLVHGERLRAVGELAAGVAHELKQPLNVIKLVAQMVLNDKKKGRFKEAQLDENLNDVVSQVNRMAEIIDHMRIFTRRTDPTVMEAQSANDRVESACKFFLQQLKNHGIEFVKELGTDLPMIRCNPLRLEQVIMNFVSNARKALEESKKENKKIVIRTYRTSVAPGKDCVVIEVRDNANGVPEAIAGKIFEPFFTTAAPGQGTGLGLSICFKIVEEHGGKIELDNKVGEGAAFRMVLPAIIDASKVA